MAEQQESRTEQATPRRLERAQQEGQIAYSSDLTSAVMLLITSIVLAVFSEYFLNHMANSIARFVELTASIGHDQPDWPSMAASFISDFFGFVIPIVLMAFVSTVSIAGFMTGFKPSWKALQVKPSKIHPANGVKRIFSLRSLMRGIVAIGKLIALTIVASTIVYLRKDSLIAGTNSIEAIVRTGWAISAALSIAVAATLVILGIMDFMFQKWKHLEDMKMSKQEVVDERKEDEGDPHMRARIRKLQREIGQRRMLDDVRDATVVITNPTHFAVALKYERSSMPTPKVVAKGKDHMALKIIALARQNDVIVVERKPLARALYHAANVGEEIPVDVFQAVAEVIAYVYQLKRAA